MVAPFTFVASQSYFAHERHASKKHKNLPNRYYLLGKSIEAVGTGGIETTSSTSELITRPEGEPELKSAERCPLSWSAANWAF